MNFISFQFFFGSNQAQAHAMLENDFMQMKVEKRKKKANV